MAHPFSNRPEFKGLHDDLLGFGSAAPLSIDIQAAVVQQSRAIQSRGTVDGSLWSSYASLYAPCMSVLQGGDTDGIRLLVSELHATPLTHGFSQGAVVTADLRARAGSRMHVGSITLDRFYRLAEAVGAVRVRSSEHGQRTIEVEDIDGIMTRIEEAVGAKLPATRQSGALFGLRIRGSIYSERHFDGIYAAWRLRELMKAKGVSEPSLLEIGGGAGFLCFYARQLGFRRAAIIDLPHPALTQYLVLGSEFGARLVEFGSVPANGIGLIDVESPLARDFTGWDAVVNVDSMPEMRPADAGEYLSRIQPGQVLLSINQESGVPNGDNPQNVVGEMAASFGLVRRQRYPAWLRTGYVEEVYER